MKPDELQIQDEFESRCPIASQNPLKAASVPVVRGSVFSSATTERPMETFTCVSELNLVPGIKKPRSLRLTFALKPGRCENSSRGGSHVRPSRRHGEKMADKSRTTAANAEVRKRKCGTVEFKRLGFSVGNA